MIYTDYNKNKRIFVSKKRCDTAKDACHAGLQILVNAGPFDLRLPLATYFALNLVAIEQIENAILENPIAAAWWEL